MSIKSWSIDIKVTKDELVDGKVVINIIDLLPPFIHNHLIVKTELNAICANNKTLPKISIKKTFISNTQYLVNIGFHNSKKAGSQFFTYLWFDYNYSIDNNVQLIFEGLEIGEYTLYFHYKKNI